MCMNDIEMFSFYEFPCGANQMDISPDFMPLIRNMISDYSLPQALTDISRILTLCPLAVFKVGCQMDLITE